MQNWPCRIALQTASTDLTRSGRVRLIRRPDRNQRSQGQLRGSGPIHRRPVHQPRPSSDPHQEFLSVSRAAPGPRAATRNASSERAGVCLVPPFVTWPDETATGQTTAAPDRPTSARTAHRPVRPDPRWMLSAARRRAYPWPGPRRLLPQRSFGTTRLCCARSSNVSGTGRTSSRLKVRERSPHRRTRASTVPVTEASQPGFHSHSSTGGESSRIPWKRRRLRAPARLARAKRTQA